MKKILSALIVLTFILSPVSPIGSVFVQDHVIQKAEARGYKSVRRGFTPTPKRHNQQPKKDNTNQNNSYNKSTNNKTTAAKNGKRGFFSGGLARGLFIGGLAGLLFGGLLGNMGMFGSFLGLLINVVAILFIINLVMNIIRMMRDKKRHDREGANQWRN